LPSAAVVISLIVLSYNVFVTVVEADPSAAKFTAELIFEPSDRVTSFFYVILVVIAPSDPAFVDVNVPSESSLITSVEVFPSASAIVAV
jgi:hypothetical protein